MQYVPATPEEGAIERLFSLTLPATTGVITNNDNRAMTWGSHGEEKGKGGRVRSPVAQGHKVGGPPLHPHLHAFFDDEEEAVLVEVEEEEEEEEEEDEEEEDEEEEQGVVEGSSTCIERAYRLSLYFASWYLYLNSDATRRRLSIVKEDREEEEEEEKMFQIERTEDRSN
ncbi:hypothetical protein M0804_004132 [Polistes exclamans]|nr:hypothetical protein M0804_004132 [Polistes exclamans]